MDEQKQSGDHWRELADLLGLADDAPPAKKPESAPAPEAPVIKAYDEPSSARIVEEPELGPDDELPAATIPMTREAPAGEWEAEYDEDEDDTQEFKPLTEEAAPAAERPGAAPAASGEEEPRRGRRRRRRGRRRGGDRPEGEGQPHRPAGDQDARPGREDERRGPERGRQRRDEDRPQSEAPEPDDADDTATEQPAPRPVSASDTDFSDWNVPSWQELISSLYRPDR